MRFPKFEILILIVICCAGGMLYTSNWHFWSNGYIVEQRYWPAELVELVNDSAETGDAISEIEVRSAGFVTTYIWKMAATEKRLDLHKKKFDLTAVGLNGVEQKRILAEWPRAWSRSTSECDLYANPVGLPGAEDGEFEFILLHDKGTANLYFYYYFNF
ncbi:MAG: hypothetical protein JNK57_14090 [Planctomycetaceae bacterium]|nr:hypothetical protein [Planctomycetaceae bacterium]